MAWEVEKDDSGEYSVVCSKYHKSESEFFEIKRSEVFCCFSSSN